MINSYFNENKISGSKNTFNIVFQVDTPNPFTDLTISNIIKRM